LELINSTDQQSPTIRRKWSRLPFSTAWRDRISKDNTTHNAVYPLVSRRANDKPRVYSVATASYTTRNKNNQSRVLCTHQLICYRKNYLTL